MVWPAAGMREVQLPHAPAEALGSLIEGTSASEEAVAVICVTWQVNFVSATFASRPSGQPLVQRRPPVAHKRPSPMR